MAYTMSSIIEVTYVAMNIIILALIQVHSESLEWLKEALTSFGFLINLKPHIDYIKKAFGASNPAGTEQNREREKIVHLFFRSRDVPTLVDGGLLQPPLLSI